MSNVSRELSTSDDPSVKRSGALIHFHLSGTAEISKRHRCSWVNVFMSVCCRNDYLTVRHHACVSEQVNSCSCFPYQHLYGRFAVSQHYKSPEEISKRCLLCFELLIFRVSCDACFLWVCSRLSDKMSSKIFNGSSFGSIYHKFLEHNDFFIITITPRTVQCS